MSRSCHLSANRLLHAEIQRIRLLHLCLTMTRQCPWKSSLASNTTDKCGRCNSGSRIRRKSPVRGKSISHLSLTIVYINLQIPFTIPFCKGFGRKSLSNWVAITTYQSSNSIAARTTKNLSRNCSCKPVTLSLILVSVHIT